MTSASARRLSLFAGGIVSFLWVVLLLILALTAFPPDEILAGMGGAEWMVLAISIVASFLVPFALVRAAAWVVSGFTNKQE